MKVSCKYGCVPYFSAKSPLRYRIILTSKLARSLLVSLIRVFLLPKSVNRREGLRTILPRDVQTYDVFFKLSLQKIQQGLSPICS